MGASQAARTAPRFPIPFGSLAATFAGLSRDDLGAIAEAAIDEMDRRDPDADLELNGDEADANGSEEDFLHHGANWLAEPGCPVSDPGDEDKVLSVRPIYGADQTLGPINQREAVREHRAAQLGLVLTATGGWRHA